MKIIVLNHTNNSIEVFTESEKAFTDWCLENKINSEEELDFQMHEHLNDFITCTLEQKGFDNAYFMPYIVCDNDEKVPVISYLNEKEETLCTI